MNIEIREDIEILEEDCDYIKKSIETVLSIEKLEMEGEVSVLITDNQGIQNFNRDYRNQDKVTDVLSFYQYTSIEEIRKDSYVVLGDIVINLDRVIEQAKELNHSKKRELGYLTIHSMYHLLGYDHMNPQEKIEMRAKEEAAYSRLEKE